MKRFLIKLTLVALIICSFILMIGYFLLRNHTAISIKIINQNSIDSSDILILGDSRAERHINPFLLHAITKKNCLNIAVAGMDLYSLSKRLENLNLSEKTLIISASSWQLNDAITKYGYFRYEAFNDLSLSERLLLYSHNIADLKEMLFINIQHSIKFELVLGKNNVSINQGYTNIECKDFDTTQMFSDHLWYKEIINLGVKEKLLFEALVNLNKLNCKNIIIYNAPVYNGFKEQAIQNGSWIFEKKYGRTIDSMITNNDLRKIAFYDLTDLDSFQKSDFYDPQHLCEKGANKFTKIISSFFKL